MPRTLRARLVFLVATAALSLVTLTVTGTLVAARVEHQLSLIQSRYVPKLELGPKLESQFVHITRSLQDAVAAQDASALDESAALKIKLSWQLLEAKSVLDARDVADARAQIDDYYTHASDLSRRLIAGETGVELVSAMSLMQLKQASALESLRKAVAFDRNELSAAFAAVTRSELEASRIRLIVSVACLAVVSLLYYWLSRGILRALSGLSAGFERFGRGEFDQPIVLATRDELAELAERANEMARSLQRLNEALRANNEELHTQQEELRHSNRALTATAKELEAQRMALELKNAELDATRQVLEKNAVELKMVSAYKTQFLANMSHELRTPLNSMLLLSKLLAANDSHNLTDKQVEYCRTIHGAGRDLLALINQVLDLAKIEAGKQEIQVEVVPLQRWVEHAENIFAPVARDKGLAFEVELAPDCPSTITTDGKRVEQILNNLLGNALKFTSQGSVTLRVASAGRALELSVIDTGIGIAAEHLERIFAPFEQADASQERRFGGTGLGLSIARELASLLGGELRVSSVLHQGTTFVFSLPFEPPKSAARTAAPNLAAPKNKPANAQSTAAEAGCDPVLIVDDDPHHAQSLVELLQRQQFEVLSVTSAAQALSVLEQRSVSCVVLDLSLPDADGLELMEQLSKRPDGARLPVVVYTGRVLSKTEAKRLLGFSQAVVLKGGAGAERVVEEIRYVIKKLKAGLRPSLRAAAPSLHTAARLDGRLVLVVDDDMRTVYALSALLRGKGAEVLVAESGTAALTALRAQPAIDIVLLDIAMPELDGFETLSQLRADERLSKLPVIALTAKTSQYDRQKCIDKGATDYFAKPVDGEKLVELMQRCLSDNEQLDLASGHNSS